MSAGFDSCTDLVAGAAHGVAPALAAVDCMSGRIAAGSFARMLGPGGALGPALLAALTVYVAGFGLMLLAGRVRLHAAPGRIMMLGLVLAFATSWAAYGPMVWSLAERAPDEVAGALIGTKGSATAAFATRVDMVFAAVGEATREAEEEQARRSAEADAAAALPQAPVPGVAPTPQNPARAAGSPAGAGGVPASAIAWGAAAILLLSTLGVLVAARIVLAVLLMLGPVFIVTALFAPTRGLFAGWLRATLLAALAPMLAVLAGTLSLELAVPNVARLSGPDGIDPAAAMGFFLIASVHAALMIMALRAAGQMVAGWKPAGAAGGPERGTAGASGMEKGWGHSAFALPKPEHRVMPAAAAFMPRSGNGFASETAAMAPTLFHAGRAERTADGARGALPAATRRAAGIGSRFRSPPPGRRLA